MTLELKQFVNNPLEVLLISPLGHCIKLNISYSNISNAFFVFNKLFSQVSDVRIFADFEKLIIFSSWERKQEILINMSFLKIVDIK